MMAELRRQEDELYTERAGTLGARQGVSYKNDIETQDANRPRVVNTSSWPNENETVRSDFDHHLPASTSDLTNRQSTQTADALTPLFSTEDVTDLRSRWGTIQTGFVDEPRWAVREADNLVAAAIDRLTTGFAERHSALEKQWDRGDEVSTEELRLAMQRYRTFFDRLLNV